jgi:hypothetical protein
VCFHDILQCFEVCLPHIVSFILLPILPWFVMQPTCHLQHIVSTSANSYLRIWTTRWSTLMEHLFSLHLVVPLCTKHRSFTTSTLSTVWALLCVHCQPWVASPPYINSLCISASSICYPWGREVCCVLLGTCLGRPAWQRGCSCSHHSGSLAWRLDLR